MKKLLALVLAVALMTCGLTACGSKTDLESTAKTEASTSDKTAEKNENAPVKVALVLTTAGLGDNNLNDMAYNGLLLAQEKYGIAFNYAEPKSTDEASAAIIDFAQDGSYDLIIGLSNEPVTGIEEASAAYPNQKFISAGVKIEGDNICCLMKNEPEQMFLTGVIAGALTQDTSYEYVNEEKVVGVILGIDLIQKMGAGYMAGARFFDTDVKVLTSSVGDFSDVNTAKEMALSMVDQGADVIQNLDGGGVGIWAAAEEKPFYGLGVGASQNGLSDCIVATAGYSLSNVICNNIKAYIDGTWEAGTILSTTATGDYELITEGAKIALSDEIMEKVNLAKEWLANTDVALPVSYAEVDAWVEANHWGG